MKRRAFKLIVFVLAGAIINVGVAWACTALTSDEPTGVSTAAGFLPPGPNAKWGWDVFTGASRCAVRLKAYPRAGKSMLQQSWNENELYPSGLHWQDRLQELASASSDTTKQKRFLAGGQTFDARGWPMLALMAHWDGNDTRDPVHSWKWGIAISGDVTKANGGVIYQNFKALPLRPLWPGFAINTIFYAAIAWMLFAVPGAVRRRVRIKRGQCASCGYSLRESVSEKCPECGKPFSHAGSPQTKP